MDLCIVIPPKNHHELTILALDKLGKNNFSDFVDEQKRKTTARQRTKIFQMLENIAKHGIEVYRGNERQLISLEKGLYELKPFDTRVLFFQVSKSAIIVTSAFLKPKGQKKVQNQFIDEGLELMNNYIKLNS